MRGETVRALVECIAHGIDTKRKIMAETGFSWGSVATITTELLENGVIDDNMYYSLINEAKEVK